MRYPFGILQRWSNVLAKSLNPFPEFTGWPYTFVVTPELAASITVGLSSTDHLFSVTIKQTPAGGSEQTDTHYSYNGWSGTFTNLDPGSMFSISTPNTNSTLTINGYRIV